MITTHKSTDTTDPESLQEIGGQGFLSKEFSLWNRYVVQKMLVSALLATNYHKHLAEKVANCHKRFRHRRCNDCGSRWATSKTTRISSCSQRLCPHCAHDKAMNQAKKVQKFCVGREGLRYVVLAEKNSKNLQKGIASLYAAWDSLRRSVRWKAKVRGAIVVLEVTYNKQSRSWHPHLNVLFEGEYFPFEELRQLWMRANKGRGRTARISKADNGTAFELIKYVLKVVKEKDVVDDDGSPLGKIYELLIDEPDVLDEFLSSVYGVRLVRTYGTFRKMQVEEEADEVEQGESCPDCGSKSWVDVGPVCHQDQLTFDFQKNVFRPVKIPEPSFGAQSYASFVFCTSPEARAIAIQMRRARTKYENSVAGYFRKAA